MTERSRFVEGKRGFPPGPRGYPIIGVLPYIRRDQRLSFLTRTAATYGGLASFTLGRERVFLVSKPELVREVLHSPIFVKDERYKVMSLIFGDSIVTSEGELWRRHRRTLQPSYSETHLRLHAGVMLEETRALCESWKEIADGPGEVELGPPLQCLAYRIAPRVGFSVDVGPNELETIVRSANAVSTFMSQIAWSMVRVPHWAPTRENRKMRAAKAVIRRLIQDIYDARVASGRRPADLLSLLIDARDTETGTPFSRSECCDEMMAYLVNGHGATGAAITATFALIAQNPEVRRRIEREVDLVTGFGEVEPEHLPKLSYLRRVFLEGIRLYPPVWIWSRSPTEDLDLDGYRIPKGARVLVSAYVTHRQPMLWEDPEAFDPARFEPDREPPSRYAYFPFGGGRRVCPGENFGMQEALAVIATVSRRFRLEIAPGSRFDPNPVLTMRGQVTMRIRSRRETEAREVAE